METATWHISSTRGTASASFAWDGRAGTTLVGDLHFSADSVDRPEHRLWETSFSQVEVDATAFQSLLWGMEDWVSDSKPFSVELLAGDVRLRAELRVEDNSLLLEPGKAGLHFIWDGIAVQNCEIAFVVDQTCVQESIAALHALLGEFD